MNREEIIKILLVELDEIKKEINDNIKPLRRMEEEELIYSFRKYAREVELLSVERVTICRIIEKFQITDDEINQYNKTKIEALQG